MSNHIVVSGCSYTEDAVWPKLLFPDSEIANLGKSGAGNRYISESIIRSLDPDDLPNLVFALFSGINRSDVVLPASPGAAALAIDYKYHARVGESIYFFSGGDKYNRQIVDNYNRIKDQNWSKVHCFDDFLELPMHVKQECLDKQIVSWTGWDVEQMLHCAFVTQYLSNTNFLQEQTYYAIISLQNCLERYQVPYYFGFVYNPWDRDYQELFGCLDKKNRLYDRVNWDKFINVFPFETGMEFGLLCDDNIHLTPTGQKVWADIVVKNYFG